MLLLASRIGLDNARDLCLLHMADQGAHSPMVARRARWTNALLDELDRIEKEGDCWSLEQLAVNGRDMLALGISGPAVGEMLHYLLEAVVRFHVPNDHDLLMQAAKAHYERSVTAFSAQENGRNGSGK